MRARRFSRPSIYLALHMISLGYFRVAAIVHEPFRRLAFLFHLCEYALCLVVLAVRARGHLAITLDLLLSAHVAGLCPVSIVTPSAQFHVLWLFSSSLDRPGRCDHPYRPAQTCSGEAATDRTGRCQRCAEAAGSSLAAVHRRSRSVRCSWLREWSNSKVWGAQVAPAVWDGGRGVLWKGRAKGKGGAKFRAS